MSADLDRTVLRELLDMTGGNLATVERITELFRTKSSQTLEELVAASAAGDAEAIARCAHALKSMSANMGARGVAEAAAAMERSRASRVPEAQIEALRGLLAQPRACSAKTSDPPERRQRLHRGDGGAHTGGSLIPAAMTGPSDATSGHDDLGVTCARPALARPCPVLPSPLGRGPPLRLRRAMNIRQLIYLDALVRSGISGVRQKPATSRSRRCRRRLRSWRRNSAS